MANRLAHLSKPGHVDSFHADVRACLKGPGRVTLQEEHCGRGPGSLDKWHITMQGVRVLHFDT